MLRVVGNIFTGIFAFIMIAFTFVLQIGSFVIYIGLIGLALFIGWGVIEFVLGFIKGFFGG